MVLFVFICVNDDLFNNLYYQRRFVFVPTLQYDLPGFVYQRTVVRDLYLYIVFREAVHHASLAGLLKQNIRLLTDMGFVECMELAVGYVQ